MKVLVASAYLTGMLILVALIYFAVAVPYAWAFHLLWLWFVVPVLKVDPLNLWQAFGLGLLIRLFTSHTAYYKDLKVDSVKSLRIAFAFPFFAVLTGWIIRPLAF